MRATTPPRHRCQPPPAAVLVAHLRDRLLSAHTTLFVGIDGRSGAGKSTLAAAASKELAGQVGVIDGDDFYAGGSADRWDRWTTAEAVEGVIDWPRQRTVLEQLRHEGVAAWHPFDWDANGWDGDLVPLAATARHMRATPVLVLDGTYSCRPELHDLLDLRVLLDTPPAVRHQQLLAREGDSYRSDWESRWAAAEDHYFGTVMPPEHFDLCLTGA